LVYKANRYRKPIAVFRMSRFQVLGVAKLTPSFLGLHSDIQGY
jgi:hypothetical protein